MTVDVEFEDEGGEEQQRQLQAGQRRVSAYEKKGQELLYKG
jgi:hypothetical protein